MKYIETIDDLITFLKVWHDVGEKDVGLEISEDMEWLPASLKKLYQHFGQWIKAGDRAFSTQDSLVFVQTGYEVWGEGYLNIMHENQGVWKAFLKRSDCVEGKEPLVYIDTTNSEPDGMVAKALQKDLEHFLISFCLQEALFSAPYLWAVDYPLPETEFQETVSPIWLDGFIYPSKKPSHDFHITKDDSTLLFGLKGGYEPSIWIGSRNDNINQFFPKHKKFNSQEM